MNTPTPIFADAAKRDAFRLEIRRIFTSVCLEFRQTPLVVTFGSEVSEPLPDGICGLSVPGRPEIFINDSLPAVDMLAVASHECSHVLELPLERCTTDWADALPRLAVHTNECARLDIGSLIDRHGAAWHLIACILVHRLRQVGEQLPFPDAAGGKWRFLVGETSDELAAADGKLFAEILAAPLPPKFASAWNKYQTIFNPAAIVAA